MESTRHGLSDQAEWWGEPRVGRWVKIVKEKR